MVRGFRNFLMRGDVIVVAPVGKQTGALTDTVEVFINKVSLGTFTGFNKIANKNNAAYNFNINPYNPVSSSDSSYATPGGKPAGLVFGMVHFF